MVLLRKTGFFDGIYTHVYGKTNFRFKKMHLLELSGSKFHSVTSSHVILYNDVKTQFSSEVDLSGFGTELFNSSRKLIIIAVQEVGEKVSMLLYNVFDTKGEGCVRLFGNFDTFYADLIRVLCSLTY